MKLLKYFLSVLLVTVAVSATVFASSNIKFVDVSENDWFYEYVYTLVNSDVIKGTSPETFAPNDSFSIVEAATVITRYLNLEENAQNYQNTMKTLNVPGNENWFCGYMQVMHETKIFDASEYGFELYKGFISIPDASVLKTPITRKDFAAMIAKSFEIAGQLKSKSASYGIGGNGYEFIITGAYDDSIYKYESLINDFSAISPSYSESILKLYYNGIFAGDNNGNFNPDSYLTRAEMAKVICVITNFEMRYRTEFRDLPPQCILNENDFYTRSDNTKAVVPEKAYNVLCSIASRSIEFNNNLVTYTQRNLTPPGYACDAYLFTDSDSKSVCMSDIGSNYSGFSASCNTPNKKFEIILVLRNLANSCRIEGSIVVTPGENGSLNFENSLK